MAKRVKQTTKRRTTTTQSAPIYVSLEELAHAGVLKDDFAAKVTQTKAAQTKAAATAAKPDAKPARFTARNELIYRRQLGTKTAFAARIVQDEGGAPMIRLSKDVGDTYWNWAQLLTDEDNKGLLATLIAFYGYERVAQLANEIMVEQGSVHVHYPEEEEPDPAQEIRRYLIED